MKSKLVIPLLLIITFLGGCQMGKDKLPSEMNPKDLPEGRAFEDEFTRSFLQSTKEIKPGYYPFLAKNGEFEMMFPKDGITSPESYTSKSNFESLLFTDSEGSRDSSAMVNVRFYSTLNPGFIEEKKKSLSSSMKLSLDFEEVPGVGQTHYIAPFEEVYHNEHFLERYGYAAYIQRETEAGGIYVTYSIYCEANCDQNREEGMKETYEFILSIQFLDKVEEKGDS